MRIELVAQVDEELQDAVNRLVPQLTSKQAPSLAELRALVESESSSLLVARDEDDGGCIVGMACLGVYRVPTGVRAVIEDVVVDGSARGQGIGEALVRRCLEVAAEKGAAAVTLTSNSRRAAANRLYLRMGFRLRDTNAYVYRLK